MNVEFLVVRMLVTRLPQGKGKPPLWMQAWAYRTTYAVLLMTLVGILRFNSQVIGVAHMKGDLKEDVKPFDKFIVAICFAAVKYFIMTGLYILCVASYVVESEKPRELPRAT